MVKKDGQRKIHYYCTIFDISKSFYPAGIRSYSVNFPLFHFDTIEIMFLLINGSKDTHVSTKFSVIGVKKNK